MDLALDTVPIMFIGKNVGNCVLVPQIYKDVVKSIVQDTKILKLKKMTTFLW